MRVQLFGVRRGGVVEAAGYELSFDLIDLFICTLTLRVLRRLAPAAFLLVGVEHWLLGLRHGLLLRHLRGICHGWNVSIDILGLHQALISKKLTVLHQTLGLDVVVLSRRRRLVILTHHTLIGLINCLLYRWINIESIFGAKLLRFQNLSINLVISREFTRILLWIFVEQQLHHLLIH